jgi:hypothetical protein
MLAAAIGLAAAAAAAATSLTTTEPLAEPLRYEVPCAANGDDAPPRPSSVDADCLPSRCVRYVEDGFLSADEVARLLQLTAYGMSPSHASAGPTILDVNTGMLRDPEALLNVYAPATSSADPRPLAFNASDLALYRSVFDRIKERVAAVAGVDHVYFTAPTFITRLVGHADWRPRSPHDEYYAPHVDGLNTPHYVYSGLVYLSTHGVDFTGGEFAFFRPRAGVDPAEEPDGWDDEHVVLPRAGRLLVFTSGPENAHQVRRVEAGRRITFSMWFTCDREREFATFLDGRAHLHFAKARTGGGGGVEGGGESIEGDGGSSGVRPKGRVSEDEASAAAKSGGKKRRKAAAASRRPPQPNRVASSEL